MTNKQTGKIESCRNYKNAQWLARCERSGKFYSGRFSDLDDGAPTRGKSGFHLACEKWR